ncbi:MAG: M23 family metallopeptidase [Candidatus Methanofastidiosia archaeon]
MLFSIVMLIIGHLFIPFIFIIWLWRGKDKSKIDWMVKLLVVGTFVVYIFLVGRWDWLSYYLRFILIALFLIAAYKSYLRTKDLAFFSRKGLKDWVTTAINLFVLFIFVFSNILAIKGYFYYEKPVELSFPLKNGVYYITNGGSSLIINNHNVDRSQRYALDIVKLNIFGTRAKGIYPAELTKYAIFGDTIYSPCDGKVIKAIDGLPDLIPPEMDVKNLAGNHVLIECKGVKILFAHMMKGSLLVKGGDFVEEGQPIGKVGNSGNTSEPHLHIHAEKGGKKGSFLDGEGVPIIFNGKFLKRNDLFIDKLMVSIIRYMLTTGQATPHFFCLALKNLQLSLN